MTVNKTMLLAEKHVVKRSSPFFKEIDDLAFKSKNLYNAANYVIRQHFFEHRVILSYNPMAKLMQEEDAYCALPRKVSQQVLRVLDRNWKSWLEAIKEYRRDPSKFKAEPKIPKYKDKQEGRNLLVYTSQAISKTKLKERLINPSGTTLLIPTKQAEVREVRIIPRLNHYRIEVIYEQQLEQKVNGEHVAAIDIGLNNLATVTSNQLGFVPYLVNGRPLKAVNTYFNKKKARLQSQLPKQVKTSTAIRKLTVKREFKVDDYLHKASRYIVDDLVARNISTLVIGKNEGWKQELNLGSKNNQQFTYVPHARLIAMLCYKAELVGIDVVVSEESYTSKASFLDLDDIPVYAEFVKPKFSGRRVKRGLYKSKNGTKINADVNGSLNILRKVIPSAFSNGIQGVVVHPVKVYLEN